MKYTAGLWLALFFACGALLSLGSCQDPPPDQTAVAPVAHKEPATRTSAAAIKAAPAAGWKPKFMPPSPKFVEYMNGVRLNNGGDAVGGNRPRIIPAPVEWPASKGLHRGHPPKLGDYPASFDLNDLGKVSPLKSPGASCPAADWAFATFSSLESTHLPAESWDFSENNLKNTHGFDYSHCGGGKLLMSMAYLGRWSGPVLEADDPYDPGNGVSPPGAPIRQHVHDMLILPQEELTGVVDPDLIKYALTTYGAVATNMHTTIIGWDDYYPWFITKEGFTHDYDENFGGAAIFTAVPDGYYDQIYQYDLLGYDGLLDWGLYDYSLIAGVYTAGGDEVVTAVTMFTQYDNMQYEINIFKNLTSATAMPEDGELAKTYTGTVTLPGFYVLPVPDPGVAVAAGTTFSVVEKIMKPGRLGFKSPVAMKVAGYSSNATAQPNQTYLNGAGGWDDLYGHDPSSSFLIKALTVKPAHYCWDDNVCTDDRWDGLQCQHTPVARTCDDKLDCTDADTCVAGVCTGTIKPGACRMDGKCWNEHDPDPANACRWCDTATDPTQWTPRTGLACDDKSDCTTGDTCNAAAVCVGAPLPADTPCSDGELCTKGDKCDGAGVCVGTPYPCPAPNECEVSVACDGLGGCLIVNKPDQTPCTPDSNECTRDECVAGACVHPAKNDLTPCTADADQCTDDVCLTGACAHPFSAINTACNDGVPCTKSDVCDGAGTCAGESYVCAPNECQLTSVCKGDGTCTVTAKPEFTACSSDGNECTGDHCKAGQCTHPAVSNGTLCDDGDKCTGTDTCQLGFCAGTNPVVCPAPDKCHDARTCNPSTGICSNPQKPAGSGCDDGNACTMDDTCDAAGKCAGTAFGCPAPTDCQVSVSCDGAGGCTAQPKTDGLPCASDGSDCTIDSCLGGVCAHDPRPAGTACSDGNPCTKWDACNAAGQCVGTAYPCPAPTECQDSVTCDGAGGCTVKNKDNGTACSSDTNQCTDDICTNGTCIHPNKPYATPCSDGNPCTQYDGCQGGVCIGVPVQCPEEQCRAAGTCDPGTGQCNGAPKAEGTVCDDANLCTQTDRCQGGVCTGTNPVACLASDQCHEAGVCDPVTGACSNPAKADGSSCSDNNACTQTDLCHGGACAGTNPVVCHPADLCHEAGVCNASTGKCSNPVSPNMKPCDDGNVCSHSDSCLNGMCSGVTYTCPAPTQCRDITCDGSGGCLSANRAAGWPCSTGNPCSQNDSCDGAGNCISGGPNPACADGGVPDAAHDASLDTGHPDAGVPDTGAPDGDVPDGGTVDDAGNPDATLDDGGLPDAAPPDTGTPDTGDAGTDGAADTDAGIDDVSVPADASPDVSTPDAAHPADGSVAPDASKPADAAGGGDQPGDAGGGCSCATVGVER